MTVQLEALKDLDLCRRAQSGDEQALETVLQNSVKFVRLVMSRVIGSRRLPPNVSIEDGEQEGMLALIRILQPQDRMPSAWNGRDPLTTYAYRCIENQIRRWVAKTFPCVHVPEQKYVIARRANSLSLDAPANPSDEMGRTLGDCIADRGSDPALMMERREERQELLARAEQAKRVRGGRTASARVTRTSCTRSHHRYQPIPVRLIISGSDIVLGVIRQKVLATGTGAAILSVNQLADATGLGGKTVAAHLRWLATAKKIERENGQGREMVVRMSTRTLTAKTYVPQQIDFDALLPAN